MMNERRNQHLSFVDFDTYPYPSLHRSSRDRGHVLLRGCLLVGTGLLFGMLLERSHAISAAA
jgi:hypothetical protein